MNPTHPLRGKIVNHDGGLGVPTPETVRARAREIAAINGHDAVTAGDWNDAKRELHGGHDEAGAMEDPLEMAESAHDGPVGSLGHRVTRLEPEDSDSIAEELVHEGMDEAIHEQMLAARRIEPRD